MKTVYRTESLCYTAEINTTLDINFTSIKEKKKKNIHPPLALGVQFHEALERGEEGDIRTHWASCLSLNFGFFTHKQHF